MDVYEHAYFMDFGTNKKEYISTFIKNINWTVLNKRFQNYLHIMRVMNINYNRYLPYKFFNR